MPLITAATIRRALRYPTSANNGSDFAAGVKALADDVDAQLLTRSFGKSIIATTESRTNAALGLMTTPDRVQNLVLPADGLIFVAYQATWQASNPSAGRAAIFLGANQMKVGVTDASFPAPSVQGAYASGNAGVDRLLTSAPFGLVSHDSNTAYTGDVSTGQAVGMILPSPTRPWVQFGGSTTDVSTSPAAPGGLCCIFAAAGTYDISVQFAASAGSVTAKNRKLWAWTLGF